jgi:hypothetical protein
MQDLFAYANEAMRAHKDITDTQTVAELRDDVRRLAESVAKLISANAEDELGSWRLKDWLKRHNLSQSQGFKLFREGRGPELMLIGSVGKRVSREADAAWIRAREAEAREKRGDDDAKAPSAWHKSKTSSATAAE